MIITCERCSTRYQLDDSRIPERGARVRCSRCAHAFSVKRPASVADRVERAVEQSLAEDAAGSIRELAPAAAEASEPPSSLEDGLWESDWQFSDEAARRAPGPGAEPAPEDAGLAAAREAVDDLLGGDPGSPSGSDVDASLDGDLDVDDDIDALLDAKRPEAALEADAFPGPPAQEPAGSVLEEPEGPVLEEPEGPALEGAGAPILEEPEAPTLGEGSAAEEEPRSPDDWDFFADGPEDASPERAPAMGVALGRIGASAGRSVMEVVRPPIDVAAEASKTPPWLRWVAQGAGWGAVALLVAIALYQSAVPLGAASQAARTAQALAGLEAASVEGRWVDNAVAGPIYVISGELRNARSTAVVPGVRVAVRLLDEQGRVLADEVGALGPALPTARLREENPRELRAIQAREALSMAWSPIGPHDGRAFHAILEKVPVEARRFDLAAIPVEEPAPAPEARAALEVPAGGAAEGIGSAR